MKKTPALNFKLSFFLVLIFALVSLFSLLPGRVSCQKYHTAERSYAIKLGRTKPLYDIASIAPTDSLKLRTRKLNKPKYVPNFGGRRHLDYHIPSALPQGADPLFNPNQSRTLINEILPTVNIEGIGESQVNAGVPDVNGDISRDYFVEIVNATYFKVYDKNGNALSNLISANSIWSQVQQSSAGDPILLYDQQADRWFLTEFPSNNRVLLAVSVTNDPRGSWDAYAFQTPRFPDFPKYGIWNDAFYLTTNEGGPNFPLYAFNRSDLLNGFDTIQFQRLTVPKNSGVFFEVGQPVDWDGMTPPPAGSPGLVVKLHDDDWGTTTNDHVILHKIHIDWDSSANSHIELIEIPTAPFDTDGCSMESTGGFSCVPQPNGQGIDGAQWIITNKVQYRNFGTHEAFVLSFMVDVTGTDVAGIRWMEFRKTSSQDWHLYQEGTIGSDDGLHRFMSSIGIDGQGNIAIAYSVSGFDKHPSLRYTGRYATDPPGMMTFKEYEFASGQGSMNNDRYGDYASISVDPSDDQTFWFAGEYVPQNNNWSTRIVAFSASKDTFDIFPIELISPNDDPDLGPNETLRINILNRGLKTVSEIKLGYQFQDGSWFIEDALIDSLQIDSQYAHTFQTAINFGTPGNYPLRIATILDNDRNHGNDTLTFNVRKTAYRDIALVYDAEGIQDLICSSSFDNSIILRNMGINTITDIAIQVSHNGNVTDTVTWAGTLNQGEEETINISVSNLSEGVNDFDATILTINNEPDEITSNDHIEWEVNANPDGEGAILHLTTDNYPGETTWELVDESEEVIASGGPYSGQHEEFVVPFCLLPDGCYTFIIYDAFGDGINAQNNPGDYQIVNYAGETIASLSQPNFGTVNVNQFCLSDGCLLDVIIGVEHESSPGAGDGFVVAEVTNSVGNLTYSIDGGLTFQSDNIFLNLSSGTYNLIVHDDAACSDSISIQLHSCNLQTFITTIPAAGGDVGEIHISTSGGVGPLEFSLNGIDFSQDSFYTTLEPGDYTVYTRDSLGCENIDTVTVTTSVSTKDFDGSHFITLFPNPGKGIYQVNAITEVQDVFINYSISTSLGETILYGSIARYDDSYKGEISLVAFPPGIYYAAFKIGDVIAVKRIIKIN